jgi:hypothetical protein
VEKTPGPKPPYQALNKVAARIMNKSDAGEIVGREADRRIEPITAATDTPYRRSKESIVCF